MLNILQKKDLVNVVVIVTRYFGGILLGTGGLVRAYSEVTQKAIEEANLIDITMGKEYEVKVDYSNLEKLKYYAKTNNISITKIEYLNEIICNIQIPNEDIEKFLRDVEQQKINIIEFDTKAAKFTVAFNIGEKLNVFTLNVK